MQQAKWSSGVSLKNDQISGFVSIFDSTHSVRTQKFKRAEFFLCMTTGAVVRQTQLNNL
jgi:hypothetical protein